MSDVMLLGVLKMPIDCWVNGKLDKQQRYSRYLEAAQRIESDQEYIKELEDAIIALTDGVMRTDYDIYEYTGEPLARCKELELFLNQIYNKRFG